MFCQWPACHCIEPCSEQQDVVETQDAKQLFSEYLLGGKSDDD